MGNVPSAVKHCLSYQQLLREHLWIGDSVAGALDPAQVLPCGPGYAHPLANCQPDLYPFALLVSSPPAKSPPYPQGPFCSSSVVLGLTP
ncbi:3-hydroxy-3-methylglutaryl-CoA lyase, cytoplasmic [Galemys pyrenaicus]|uniref:3-hydroxy-3-methylglutaryl-CoA lyase, cytoplasmic n=1 Tax=Galemys pyrenaicus TaxID=202257 RepID=A0A8J6AN69_GALPY|nr:3-hydroxy-3-methylglutaryl-CoA lyase, cytoplasmic [Galemys pyrenaicus]